MVRSLKLDSPIGGVYTEPVSAVPIAGSISEIISQGKLARKSAVTEMD
jgi:hypothetical protein